MSKIVDIFVLKEDQLYSVQYEEDKTDIFHKIFNLWTDIEYLEVFFEKHKNKLKQARYGFATVEEAVDKTVEEADSFQEKIWKATKTEGDLSRLVFRSLHQHDYSKQHIEQKAYGTEKESWLRIYAICLSHDVYVISGGGIKLTKSMQEMPLLEKELRRLNQVSDYLKEMGILEDGDIGYLELGNDE